jgi:hypothetical protein
MGAAPQCAVFSQKFSGAMMGTGAGFRSVKCRTFAPVSARLIGRLVYPAPVPASVPLRFPNLHF